MIACQPGKRDLKSLTDLIKRCDVDGNLAVFIFAYRCAAFMNGVGQLLERHAAGLAVFADLSTGKAIDVVHDLFPLNILFSKILRVRKIIAQEKAKVYSFKKLFAK